MKKKILIILGLLIITVGYLYIEAKFLKQNYISVRKETIKDDSIPDSFNNFEIVYFSDLTCDEETDLDKIAAKINDLNPDIIVFGGDMVKESSYLYNADNVNSISDFFKSLKANHTKYAVLGEKDNSSEFVRNKVDEIFISSGFEVLNNRAIKFRINATDYINIIGLEDYVSGKLALSSAFENIKPDTYTLVVTHSPDIFNELTGTNCNLCITGHSLGGLVKIPVYGPLHQFEGARRYYDGSHSLQGMKLDITDGINPGKDNLRLFTTNEIVSYKIKKDIVIEKDTVNKNSYASEDTSFETGEIINENKKDIEETEQIEENEETTSTPAVENVFN